MVEPGGGPAGALGAAVTPGVAATGGPEAPEDTAVTALVAGAGVGRLGAEHPPKAARSRTVAGSR